MENMKFCQSCAMPLTEPKEHGTNGDGSLNQDYCCYCFENGAFLQEQTMEEAIESCVPFVLKGQPYHSEAEAREGMKEVFPKLKRWRE